MKYVMAVAVAVCGAALSSVAQTNQLQRQITEQVWKPFVRSLNAGDDEGFKAVHSQAMVRVEQDNNRLYNYTEYFKPLPDSSKAQKAKWKHQIELRFLQRVASVDNAFEVGFYKTVSTHLTTGEQSTTIGKFHVLLRKENGRWKIVMDADSRQGANEAAFAAASPLEDRFGRS